MKKYLGFLIVVVLIGFGFFLLKDNSMSKTEEKIKIGFIGPLTGEASTYGVSVKQGIELALSHAIKKEVLKEGQVEIIYEDAKCDGKEAVTAVQKLINIDKVQIIFGGQCSGETLAIAPIVEKAGVVLISSFSTSPEVTNAGDYVFRIPPSDANSGRVIAETMVKGGHSSFGIVSEKMVAAQNIIPVFENSMKKLGKDLIYEESFSSDNGDLYTIAAKIKQANPEALYVNVQTGSSGSRLVKQIKDIGYQGQVYSYFITGDDFVKSGSWVNGTIIIDLRSAKNDQILETFNSQFTSFWSEKPAYSFGSTLGYDTASIIFEALDEVGNDSEKIKDYLYNMETRPSLTGDLSFDQNGDTIGNDVYYPRKVVNNELINL